MVINANSVQKWQGQTTPDIRSKIIKNNKWLHGIANIKFHSVPFILTKFLVGNVELVKFCQGQVTIEAQNLKGRINVLRALHI